MYLTKYARSLPSCEQKRDRRIKRGRLIGWITPQIAARGSNPLKADFVASLSLAYSR